MQVHFWAAIDARDALIGADAEAAKRSLVWLAEHQRPREVPASWTTYLAPMRQAAASAAAASTEAELALGIARVAQRCGECHVALDARIERSDELDQGIAPEGPELMEDRMGRHAWSVDEFWAGLVFPSEAAWQAGIDVLSHMPKEAPQADREPVPEAITNQLEAVRALAAQASAAKTGDARAQTVAELLLSCQHCHAGS